MKLAPFMAILAVISLALGYTTHSKVQTSTPTPMAAGRFPLVDAHNHIIPGLAVETIIPLMDKAGIQKVILMANRIESFRPMGWEDTLVIEAYEKYPQRIIPFLTTVRWGWRFRGPTFLEYAERQLQTGKFKGMGEFMLKHYAISSTADIAAPEISVFADSPRMQEMMRLGAKYNVPLIIHMETTADTVAALERALLANPNTRVIWAHQNPVKMGGGQEEQYARQADPNQVAILLEKYPNLFADISVGYETRYLRLEDRKLPQDWKNLYERYNDRFVVGLDLAVSVMWEKGYLRRANVIRGWLSQLSSDTSRKLAYENIERILSAKP